MAETVRRNTPVDSAFRQFMVDAFGDDPNGYKTVDITGLAADSDNELVRNLTGQQVGDMLRSWARHKQIWRGWVCIEEQTRVKGHSRFRMERKAVASTSKPRLAVAPEPESQPDRKKPARFTGRIQSQRDDGSMLVINDDGVFTVTPVKW